MPAKDDSPSRQGFTRLELLLVLAMLGLLAAITLSSLAATRPRSNMVECQNNLRWFGQGFQVWANDHGDRFPWAFSAAQGGLPPDVAWFFLVVSNEFGPPRQMVCPSDGARLHVNSWDQFDKRYLSYFAGLHGDFAKGRSWLSGDRNISGAEGQECDYYRSPSCTSISPTSGSAWSTTIHANSGNLLFSDGSTAQVSNRELPEYIQRSVAQEDNSQMHILKP